MTDDVWHQPWALTPPQFSLCVSGSQHTSSDTFFTQPLLWSNVTWCYHEWKTFLMFHSGSWWKWKQSFRVFISSWLQMSWSLNSLPLVWNDTLIVRVLSVWLWPWASESDPCTFWMVKETVFVFVSLERLEFPLSLVSPSDEDLLLTFGVVQCCVAWAGETEELILDTGDTTVDLLLKNNYRLLLDSSLIETPVLSEVILFPIQTHEKSKKQHTVKCHFKC